MKKLTLFVATVLLSAMTFAADITWELNGGSTLPSQVPTNADLWEEFKPAFNEFNNLSKGDQTIDNCGGFTYTASGEPCLNMLTSEESGWKWLGDYLVTIATAAGKTCATNAEFRWNLDAFFNAYAGKHNAAGVDYTEAGKVANWGPAWQKAHEVQLPESVDAEYTLPVVYKGHEAFAGWYDNAELTGEALKTIPAGYKGTLYAAWGTPKYRIQVSVNIAAMGSVNVSDTTCEKDSELKIEATPKDGYKFVKWSNGETTNPLIINVAEELTLEAEFDYAAEPVIAWELNGGKVDFPVPADNEALWEEFKAYYLAFYKEVRGDQPITMASTFMTQAHKMMTDDASAWKWLGNLITEIAMSQSRELLTEVDWRFAVHAFFNCLPSKDGYAGNPDFTDAGKPEVWQSWYQKPTLPTKALDVSYKLPTPTKEDSTFKGWFDNANGEGEAMEELPAYWYGTVYAIWESEVPSAVENTTVAVKAQKVIRNGQVLMVRDGKTFNMMGVEVK